MNTLLEFIVTPVPEQEILFSALKTSIPEADWRMGDSDAQGAYIKGYCQNGIDISIWLGENPADITVNARRFEGDPTEEVRSIISKLGTVSKSLGCVVSNS